MYLLLLLLMLLYIEDNEFWSRTFHRLMWTRICNLILTIKLLFSCVAFLHGTFQGETYAAIILIATLVHTVKMYVRCVPKKVDHQTHGGNFVKS